jgi:hypothetical protein
MISVVLVSMIICVMMRVLGMFVFNMRMFAMGVQ